MTPTTAQMLADYRWPHLSDEHYAEVESRFWRPQYLATNLLAECVWYAAAYREDRHE